MLILIILIEEKHYAPNFTPWLNILKRFELSALKIVTYFTNVPLHFPLNWIFLFIDLSYNHHILSEINFSVFFYYFIISQEKYK